MMGAYESGVNKIMTGRLALRDWETETVCSL